MQDLRKRVHVLQLVDETREGGVRASAQVPVPVLPEEDEATLQPAEAHAKKARLRASGAPESDGGVATANETKARVPHIREKNVKNLSADRSRSRVIFAEHG